MSLNVSAIRDKYPKGTRVRLVYINDIQSAERGTLGTVNYVDDLGVIHISWDTGSSIEISLEKDTILKVR